MLIKESVAIPPTRNFSKKLPQYSSRPSKIVDTTINSNLRKPTPAREKSKTSRKRNVIYFNPPFAANVKSRVGEKILKLVKDSFLPSNPLHKIFNKNTVKVSYRTTPNISQIIAGHNRKLLNKLSPKKVKPCTCRVQACPVEGKCQQEGTIYQATVKHTNPETGQQETNIYIGLAATSFYQMHQNHKTTLKDRSHATKSALSNHCWKLKC